MRLTWKTVVLGLLGGLVCGLIITILQYNGLYFEPVAVIGAFVLSLLVRDLGAVVAGLLVRFQLILVGIGPWRVGRTPSGWRSRFGRQGSLGLTLSIPVDNRDLAGRLSLHIVGGPVANILTAIVAVQIADLRTYPGSLAGTFAFVSFIQVCLLLWPATGNGFRTSGSLLLMLRRGGPECERWLATYWIHSLCFLGQRPSAWPDEEVRRATELRDNSPEDFQSGMILYSRCLDVGDIDGARAALARAADSFETTNFLSHAQFHIESAFMAALDGDVATADSHLGKVKGKLCSQAALHRARAARARAAGDDGESRRLAQLGILAAPLDWGIKQDALELEWLNRFAGDAVSR